MSLFRSYQNRPVLVPDEAANNLCDLPEELYDIIPEDHRQPYDVRKLLECLLDDGHLDEFQADYAKEMITGHARICGIQIGVIANHRGMIRMPGGKPPRFGGIIYTESAEKVAYFIETCNRHQTPLLFIQDVSGFMVGPDAEHSGIIRAGAQFVEAMATATVPKIVLTVNHASGAGYYAMAGQGFDPDFIFSWPTGRMGVMEGDSAVQAVFGSQLEKLKKNGESPDEALTAEMDKVRETYDMELDAKYAAARGFVDAVITPEWTQSRPWSLRFALLKTTPVHTSDSLYYPATLFSYLLISILHGGEAMKLFLMIIAALIVLSILAGVMIYKLVSRSSKSKSREQL